jgi:2,3-bisphosphoglycerate-independent phosphoglycerate mutase
MTQSVAKHVLLCILDGWGIRSEPRNNGIVVAKDWDRMLKTYPWAPIEASEHFVGLPDGQMGNSEVGHMSIGLGRVIMQDLPRISQAIADKSFENIPKVKDFIKTLKNNKPVCHLLGHLSPGGVHSHQNHILAAAKTLDAQGIQVKIHTFLDGRDTPPQSALSFLEDFEKGLKGTKCQIVTIGGRYYAMDRDKRWERIQLAYEALVDGKGEGPFKTAKEAISDSYNKGVTDEFMIPSVIGNYQGMQDGEGLWMINFRADRVRQILSVLLFNNFKEFKRSRKINFSSTLGMTEYADNLTPLMPAIFEKIPVSNGLGEILSLSGKNQLRIAETEKYAHVTFFFNGGREEPFPNEDRILIPSPKVATYDLQPAMSADEITENVLKAMHKKDHQFIVVNYANSDMVGHTGIVKAIEEAIRKVDECLSQLEKAALIDGWVILITADHGNAEFMKEDDGTPHTAHTCNPVPFLMINGSKRKIRNGGALCDIAPTVLELLDYKKPLEMTGNSLLEPL